MLGGFLRGGTKKRPLALYGAYLECEKGSGAYLKVLLSSVLLKITRYVMRLFNPHL